MELSDPIMINDKAVNTCVIVIERNSSLIFLLIIYLEYWNAVKSCYQIRIIHWNWGTENKKVTKEIIMNVTNKYAWIFIICKYKLCPHLS